MERESHPALDSRAVTLPTWLIKMFVASHKTYFLKISQSATSNFLKLQISQGQRINKKKSNLPRIAYEVPHALAPLFFPGSLPDISSGSWALTTQKILPSCCSHLVCFHLHDFCIWWPPHSPSAWKILPHLQGINPLSFLPAVAHTTVSQAMQRWSSFPKRLTQHLSHTWALSVYAYVCPPTRGQVSLAPQKVWLNHTVDTASPPPWASEWVSPLSQ